MAFRIPTLAALADRTRRAFRVDLPGSDAWHWPNNIYVTAKVVAGAVFELFGFADYIAKQIFALTADGDTLDRHGEMLGLTRRPAEPAQGIVVLTAPGVLSVDAAAVFRRTADAAEYRAVSGAALSGPGTLEIDVVAVLAGKASVALAGTALEIVSGVTGTASAEVGGDGIAQGSNVEADEPFRERILFRKRYPPHGGAASDYVLWGMAQAGVSRVYVERLWSGPGTVRVFVLMDDLYANGIAPAGEIARVADAIEMVRPAGAVVTVAAPAALAIDITISGLTPDTAAIRAQVTAELRAMIRRLAHPAGVDTPHGGMPFLATPYAFSRSWIWQSVANAAGEERHAITLPAADVALASGQIPVLGTVTFAA